MSRAFFDQQIQAQIDAQRDRYRANGWDFTERMPDSHTIGDFVGAVCSIQDEALARAFYEGYLSYLADHPHPDGIAAELVARSNIGWCFGEGMPDEQIAMWHQATGARHPIFGIQLPLTPEEAMRAGIDACSSKGEAADPRGEG